jgi:uncharacterized membrane protein
MKNTIFNISKIGKYLYAIPMVIFGLFHFLNANAMAGMVPIPGGVFWIYLTGLSFILAGVSIIIQKMDRRGSGLSMKEEIQWIADQQLKMLTISA